MKKLLIVLIFACLTGCSSFNLGVDKITTPAGTLDGVKVDVKAKEKPKPEVKENK